MENNKKPEWFELADNDQPVSRQIKNAPKRNLALIVAGILVLPIGAGFALLSHEDQSANAVETLNLTQDSPATTTSSPAQTSHAITLPTASRENENESEGVDDKYYAEAFSNSVSDVAPVATPAAITPPGSSSKDLILPPTKKSGDDDEKEHKKKSEGKESKKSENDDDDGDDD